MELNRIYIQRVDENMVDVDLTMEQVFVILTKASDSESPTHFDTHVSSDDDGTRYMQHFIYKNLDYDLISIITQEYRPWDFII